MLIYVVYMLCMCVCCVYVEAYVIVMVAEFVVWQRRTTQRVRNWLYVAATQLPTVYKVIPSQILLENIFFLEYNLTFLKNEFCCYSLWLKFWLISFLFSPLQVELRTIFWWNIGHRSSASLYLRFESCAHESLMTIGKSRWSHQLTINLRSKFWVDSFKQVSSCSHVWILQVYTRCDKGWEDTPPSDFIFMYMKL